MAAPRPIDIVPMVQVGPSAADIAGRVISADPNKQAQAQAKISLAHHQKQIAANLQAQSVPETEKDDNIPTNGNVNIAGFAIVKSVQSADTLIIMGAGPVGQAPPEKTLILSGIIVPRLARRKDQTDEPYAFQAKEFMRKLVIGKRVKFAVTYIHGESHREYGSAELDGVGDLTEKLIENGWAKLKPQKEPTGKNKEPKVKPELEMLQEKESAAIEAKAGMHAEKPLATVIRSIDYLTNGNDIREFFNANRGQILSCIVEQVREGSSLKLELVGKTHKFFVLHLAGAQAPRIPIPTPKGVSPKNEKVDPFAFDAQLFTSQRLLNRDVSVTILGCDKFNNLFGSVSVAQGDIAVALLSKGLAKYIDWSASLTTNKAELQAAELAAKSQKLRIWAKFEAAESSPSDVVGTTYTGKVTQILSGDTIIVEDGTKKEHRIAFSSIRCPRPPFRDRPADPWANESKGWVRKRLIGKKVKVAIEYVRQVAPESKDQDVRVYASVSLGTENIGESLVANGFASVIRHRMDEERSEHYDALQVAEENAIQAKKGIHGPDPPTPAIPIVDLSERIRVPAKGASEDVQKKARDLTIKIKQFFSVINRAGRVKAIVEFVFPGGRIKVYVPSENHIFTFMLSCVRFPSGRGDTLDPLAQQATDYIRSRILQHDVEIEVESMDKNDNFLGSLFIERKNLTLQLLERGLCHLVPYSAKTSKYSQELYLVENAAKKARVGIWHDYDPEAEKAAAEERAAAYKKQKEDQHAAERSAQIQSTEFICRVSELFDPCHFYFQKAEDRNLATIGAALKSLSPYNGPEFTPHKGHTCLAQSEDGTWYRVKVEQNVLKGVYLVNFFDYGSREEVTSVRPVPEQMPALKLPACAHYGILSGVKLSQDYLDFARELFQEQVWEKQLQAFVDTVDRDTGRMHVTLILLNEAGEHADMSVNEYMVRSGAVRVPSRPARGLGHLINKLRSAEKEAKVNNLGIWEYGDVSSDEDEGNRKFKDKRR